MFQEMIQNLVQVIDPYWRSLKDEEYGGFYGFVDYDLKVINKAEKGVILNSRILWFFSNEFLVMGDEKALCYANHAYRFLVDHCLDQEYGGVYWMINYDGTVKEDMKYTYNQAFAIYALSSYYAVTKNQDAITLAMNLFEKIESTCIDEYGYLEAFSKAWVPVDNEKLSENGLLAEKTMNTLLHVLEAYTELYRVTKDGLVRDKLIYILSIFRTRVFNEKEKRLEVFFDDKMNSISDLYSYGHDIEASWLLDKACEIVNDDETTRTIQELTNSLVTSIEKHAIENGALNNECFGNKVDKTRVWWVQAEAVVGFYHMYQKTKEEKYRKISKDTWSYIKTHFIDSREGSEWFWDIDFNGNPTSHKPITEPWKCPYHNGRMCLEMIMRSKVKERSH